MNTKTFTCFSEDGDEYEIDLPTRFEVCSRCEGHGTHLTPSIGEHAYTREEFEEAFFEDDEREAYFTRGGRYDVQCEECRGARVVAVIDCDRCTTDEQKHALEDLDRAEREAYYCDREQEAERRFGA